MAGKFIWIVVDRGREDRHFGRRHEPTAPMFRKAYDFGSGITHVVGYQTELATDVVHFAHDGDKAVGGVGVILAEFRMDDGHVRP